VSWLQCLAFSGPSKKKHGQNLRGRQGGFEFSRLGFKRALIYEALKVSKPVDIVMWIKDSATETMPRRDVKGRVLERPFWLNRGWGAVNAAGLGLGGALRKFCSRSNCRNVALKHSDYCRHHDVNWRRKRLKQLRHGTGKPATPTELTRLHRANLKRIWDRSPWWPASTIWLAPNLEAVFIEDVRRGGFDPAETAPVVLDILRWRWRRSLLDRGDGPAWQRALAAAGKRQARIGEPPESYASQLPPLAQPSDPRIKIILRRATGSELAAQTGTVDRATKAQERRRRARERQSSRRKLDMAEFLAEHGEILNPAFKACGLAPGDTESSLARQLALAWRAVLDEQAKFGDQSYGPARKRWQKLLRDLQS
jgi:hypothetical protein